MGSFSKAWKSAWLSLCLIFLACFALPVPASLADAPQGKAPTSKWETDEADIQALKKIYPNRQFKTTKEREAERTQKAKASERIIHYDIAAVMAKDASMIITERLTVNVTNRKIRHGITRTYPVRMRDGEDGVYRFGFELLSTKLDGREIPCKSQQKGLMIGMALGDADKMVSPGEHTYEIVYRTTGHVRSFDDHDEIYYNAVGSDVGFPVEKATFTLTLPDGIQPTLTKAFTGRAGSQGQDYKMTGSMSFETTRKLWQHEAFTVVVGWPKGVVSVPERGWFETHRAAALLGILAVVAIILVIGYYWRFAGKTPPIYPIFTPPDDLTPGMAAHADSRTFSPLMLQADLVWCAIKGYCRMDAGNPTQTVFNWASGTPSASAPKRRNIKRAAKDADDLPGKVANTIFSKDDQVVLGFESGRPKRPHTSLTNAWNNLYRYYKTRIKDLNNYRIWTPVAALAIGYLLLYLALDHIWHPGLEGNMTRLEMLWVPGIICGGGMFCIMWAIYRWTVYRYRTVKRAFVCAGYGFLALVALGALWLLFSYDWFFTLFYWLLWLMPALFGMKWHAIPNETGVKELQTVEGLKMYINTAEKHHLDIINSPDTSVEHYEAILPFAIALGCVDAWQKRYAPILEHLNYVPGWLERPIVAQGIVRDARWHMRYDAALRNSMFSAVSEVPVSASDAINLAIANSQETGSLFSSVGGFRGGGGSGGFSGRGSGGGGVGGW